MEKNEKDKLKKSSKKKVEKTEKKIKKTKDKKVVKEKEKKVKKPKAVKDKDTSKQKKEYREFCSQKFEEFNNNGKLTVALFCDTFFPIVDGVINVLDNYAKRLTKYCNVVVFVPEHNGKTTKKDYLVYGVKSMYLKFVNYDMALPEFDSEFKKLVKKLRIDLIHSHSPFFMGMFAAKFAKKHKIPLVSTFHSQYRKDFYKATKNDALTNKLLSMIMKVFNKSTEVWTMHQKSLETMLEYGYKGKYYLIPNATDFVCPEDIEDYVAQIDEKYGIKNQENVFLFVGRLVAHKNILFTCEALKILKDMHVPFKMIFVGDGPDESKLRSKIKELELQDDIILTGKIMDKKMLGAFYKRANLFLFPSLYDVSSIVQIESACYGTPVLFLDGSVTSCTVTNNQNGFVCENDVNAYADKILEILNDKENLQRVSNNAQKELYVVWEEVIEMAFHRYLYVIERNLRKLTKLQNIKEYRKAKKKTKNS